MKSASCGQYICCLSHILILFGLAAAQSLQGQNRPVDRAVENWKQLLGVDNAPETSSFEDRREEEDQDAPDTTPLGLDVVSIHLLSNQEKATMSPDSSGEAIVIDPEIPAPETLRSLIEPFIGKPASMALFADLGKEIVSAWRDSDYPLVDVYFPEQNITEGKIQIVVREALLGEKAVNGAVFSKESYLLEQTRVESGGRINARILEADIDWLNENPSRHVNLVYERGDEDGTTDVVLEVDEDKQLKAYAGFANTGLSQTGENEFSFGFSVGNPFEQEQAIGYNFTTDQDWEYLYAHSIFYQAFLPWRHTFGILGAYVESTAQGLAPLGIEGVSQQWTGQYRIPLGRPDFNRRWQHYFSFAFDYKSTDSDLLFGGSGFFGTEVAIGQFRGGYEFSVPDKLGYTRVAAELVYSPGNLYGSNNDLSFDTARMGSTSDYFYGYAELDRIFSLPGGFRLVVDARAQATGDRLVSTELILGGGYNTVRGFDESIIQGDSGVLGSVELVTPDLPVCRKYDGKWTGIAFYDFGAFSISNPIVSESSPSLQSVGLGLNLSMGERGYARAAYGWALEHHGVDPAFVTDGKFHFGLTITY